MPEVVPTLSNKAVRKWRRMLLAIADEAAEVPEAFFGVDHLPIALPADHKDMGYVSTDGITVADSLSSEDTTMLQSLTPVRTDLTGRTQSLTVAFGESNAWTNALSHGLPVSDWAAAKEGPWLFDDEGAVDWPYYRLLLIGQDGLGSKAVYRVEYAYRAKVTAKTDRAFGSAAETIGFTFGLYLDEITGKSYTRAENGPALNPEP